jgi:IS5 family transposase
MYRWFIGLGPDESVWDATVFSKNRERFLKSDISERFFREVVALARNHRLMSEEHFSVDGTLIESLASLKSFRSVKESGRTKKRSKKNDSGNPTVNFHGEKRRNDTHQSTTDPEARLYRKGSGKEAKLCYSGHVLMENRNGLIVDCSLSQATGKAERIEALKMLKRLKCRKRRITLGADKGYDTKEFVREIRKMQISPHIARKKYSILDGRTTRHAGYEISQRIRKRTEEIFGWKKVTALMRKSRFFGLDRSGSSFLLAAATFNLLRICNINRRRTGL